MKWVIDSFDRNLDHCHEDRTKGMCLQTSVGDNSTRPKPNHFPEWQLNCFSDVRTYM